MYPFQIGVLLDSFRLETAAALDKAAELGVKGIQIYATKGEMSPESLTAEQLTALKEIVGDLDEVEP